jgi:hypothetical protein
MSRKHFVLFLVAVFLWAAPLLAQINRGAICGSISDPSGAVPGVEVIARNTGTSIEVVGSAVGITPDSVQARTVVTSKEYENLPLAAISRVRLATDFALFTPGVLGGQQCPGEQHTCGMRARISSDQGPTWGR